jgi:hypothetical protein
MSDIKRAFGLSPDLDSFAYCRTRSKISSVYFPFLHPSARKLQILLNPVLSERDLANRILPRESINFILAIFTDFVVSIFSRNEFEERTGAAFEIEKSGIGTGIGLVREFSFLKLFLSLTLSLSWFKHSSLEFEYLLISFFDFVSFRFVFVCYA